MRVVFYLDGEMIHIAYKAPHSFDWDSSKISNGTHTLIAKAYDANSNTGSSPLVTFQINNTKPVEDSLSEQAPDFRAFGALFLNKLSTLFNK